MRILLTGAAGFIGFHVANALLARGEEVVGVDNLNAYYDVALKQARLDLLTAHPAFSFVRLDVAHRDAVAALGQDFDAIVHLAAQAGVRHALVDPYAYVTANVMGQVVVLEAARRMPALRHVVYASSSSVYGGNQVLPFTEDERVDQPVSLYAATKRADELIAMTYAHQFGMKLTGLRFFTVYGPWGRPDMAYFSFAEAIVAGRPITLYDEGRPRRDFTYVDDIVAGVLGVLDRPPSGHRLLNIGNHAAEPVSRLVTLLEEGLGRRAIIHHAPRPPADVEATFADVGAIGALTGFRPATPLDRGIGLFLAWYRIWRGHASERVDARGLRA